MIRLDKYISDNTRFSRSESRDLIKRFQIAVDGKAINKIDYKVDPVKHSITIFGKPVEYNKQYYLIMNKPSGYVSTTDLEVKESVMYLIEEKVRKRVFPVGRLDKDTTGLLLFTSDGDFNHMLMAPKKKVNKTYDVTLDKPLEEGLEETFLKGIDIGGYVTKESQMKKIDECRALLTIQEGKFHQVKRMFEAVGFTVIKLHRLSVGSLELDGDLKPGEYRKLTDIELELLRGENQ